MPSSRCSGPTVRLARRLADQVRNMKTACVEPAQMRSCDEICESLSHAVESMKRRQTLMGEIVSVMNGVKAEVQGENDEIARLLKDIED